MITQPSVEVHSFRTPNGATVKLATRPETIDWNLSFGILTEDEYGLRGKQFSGTMLDIGGYIGAVGLALAVENADLRVVIVEPVPENCEIIRQNIDINGLADRVQLIGAAAGTDQSTEIIYRYQHVDSEPDGYVQASRFVGNIYAKDSHPMDAEACMVPGRSLATLLAEVDVERVALMKIDCEGCEWAVLADPAVRRVDAIVGEWHGDPRLPGLRKMLRRTHTVEQIDNNPVNGIFWAMRK